LRQANVGDRGGQARFGGSPDRDELPIGVRVSADHGHVVSAR
jgi:hypothetical protein